MDYSIFAIIFVFGVLVIIHELGHFLAAKWLGVRVERFSVGFPPRLFGKKIGDTDYCVSAIPIGGYVKMSGMIDESMDTDVTGAEYEFSSKPVWKRIIIIIAGVTMNFFLAVLVLAILNYTKGERTIPFTEIGAIGKDGIAKKIGFQIGDNIKTINNVPVKTWNGIYDEFINNLNNDILFTVERDGRLTNLIYEKEWFSEKNAEYLDIAWMPSSQVGNIIEDMPAAKVGLKKGDIIFEINGRSVKNWLEMTRIIRDHPGDSLRIQWTRENEIFSAHIIPASIEETDSTGKTILAGKIGVEQYYDLIPVSLSKAIINGFTGTINLIGLNVKGLWWVISGTKSAKEVIGGPIMIAKMAGDAAAAGWDQLWRLIAALSAVLAFINILPIPALDGGHLVLLLLEGITGKPVSTKTKLVIQQVGLAILLTLIVFVLYTDIQRILF